MSIAPDLLEILRCPKTGLRLRLVRDVARTGEFLETADGKLRYPISGGMPHLTREDAIAVSPGEDRP